MPSTNLLFLFTDEQRYDTLAAYGNNRIEMPNLNRFAERATVCEQAYVTQPVCTPSRSSIMTGLWPHENGCMENNLPLGAEYPCLNELLRDDYVSAYHGKWHLGDEIFRQHGFDEWVAIEDTYAGHYGPDRDPSARSAYHHFLVENDFTPADGTVFSRGEALRCPEEFGKPAFLAREASRFIRQNRNRPFVLYVNFFEPHMPFFSQRDGQYEPGDIALPANYEASLGEGSSLKARLLAEHYRRHGNSGLPLGNEAEWRRMIANYWGLCSLVDTHVGTILATVEDCGLLENTIIVYTSDHGDMMGSHRLLAKCVMYEEAVRVPLLLRLPGQDRAGRIGGPVSQIDLVPTLLDLMGQPVPEDLSGCSRRSEVCEGVAFDDDVFIEWNGPNNGLGDVAGEVQLPPWMTEMTDAESLRAAMTDPVRSVITPEGWKFNCSPLGEHELYDLNHDPLETTNLAHDPAQQARLRELAGRIRAWQQRVGDRVALPRL